MIVVYYTLLLWLSALLDVGVSFQCPTCSKTESAAPPNIVIILSDDLGWNDVSFHGSDQFPTPNIDALAYSGIILKDYYTQPICTPARAALLTGRHPIHNGMEHDVIYAPEPWGLPLTECVMPQYLQSLGYVSRAVGKWHLGFFKADYTPSRRGFLSHYGCWLGHQDHYTHMGYDPDPGFDFHRELNVAWEAEGKYAADLLTEEAEAIINSHNVSQPLFLYVAHLAPHAPLQAPQEYINKFNYIPQDKRQIYAAMVTKLDESVGRITQALKHKNMLNNSIILFMADNGGATNGFNGNVASNWPLRGCKDTLWEGGVRGAGLIWSPLLAQASPRVHHGLINVQDWLPTLLSATGASNHCGNLSNLDGVSQWSALKKEAAPPYQTMLHNIDPDRKIAALRHGDWKLLIGRTYKGAYDGFYGNLTGEVPYDLTNVRMSLAGQAVQTTSSPLPESSTMYDLRAEATVSCFPETPHVIQVRQTKNEGKKTSSETMNGSTECKPHIAPCLFNIKDDPCEIENIAASYPEVVIELTGILKAYHLVPPNNQPADLRSLPKNWNNTWTTWMDFLPPIIKQS